MLMLDNSCVWNFSVCVVYHSVTLIVICIKNFCFKANRTIFENTIAIVIELVDRSCKERFLDTCCIIAILNPFKIVCVSKNINAIKHFFDNLCVTTNRNTLIAVIEVVVIECKAEWKTLNDKCRKVFAVTLPLLFCVALDKLLINIFTYK